jgi:3-dehydroquinate dehydratase type I
MIGPGWREVVRNLRKPWLACNRRSEEGGKWWGGEEERITELLEAAALGAAVVDIELATPGVEDVVAGLKDRAECMVSFHDLDGTPAIEWLRGIVRDQLAAGADICKVVTTAHGITDNVTVMQLIRDFHSKKVISFAMGDAGQTSRILCPVAGGYFTYASVEKGSESAAGQVTVNELVEIYRLLGYI